MLHVGSFGKMSATFRILFYFLYSPLFYIMVWRAMTHAASGAAANQACVAQRSFEYFFQFICRDVSGVSVYFVAFAVENHLGWDGFYIEMCSPVSAPFL